MEICSAAAARGGVLRFRCQPTLLYNSIVEHATRWETVLRNFHRLIIAWL